MRRYQFVWWRYRWWKLFPKRVGAYPVEGEHRGKIYSSRWVFGPLEIRKWSKWAEDKSENKVVK